MEEKSYHLLLLIGLFLCLLQSKGVSSSCGDINEIESAEITYEPDRLAPHIEGTNATVECDIFYQIVPTDFHGITCVNGSWTGTGALPRCRHVPRYCQRNDGLVQIYGRECQLRCRNRLQGACPGNEKCHCDGVCGWSCIAMYEDNFCPEVGEKPGLVVAYDPPERRFNGYANFSCSEGYIYQSGSPRLRCMSHRRWARGNEFVCRPNDVCGELPSVEHASLQPSGKHFFLRGESRSYSCNLGYTISGNREITCDENYSWSQPQFSCTPRSCGYPGRIDNADLTTRRYQFTDRAIYVCRDGYENPPYTPSYRTCQADGEWTHFIPTCQPIQCPEIINLDNGRVDNSWGNAFESQISFQCNDGYRLDGSARRACQGDKTWSGQETVCTEIICNDPGVPRNGYKTNEKLVYRHNNVVYFGCNDGFTMEGSVSNYCQESGEWAHPVPVCGGPCTIPPYPRDGGWTYGNRPRTSVPHNTRLLLRCNYRFTERLSSLACNDGEWSDSDDVHRLCEGTPCRIRSSIGLNITYTPPVLEEDLLRNRIQHDTRVRYTCARGYYVSGVEETRCVHGSYENSPSTPRCQPVTCQVEEIDHGKFSYISSTGGDTPNPVHWDTRQLECNKGYQTRSSGSGQCDNGVWINVSTDQIVCDPLPCDPIPVTNMRSVHYNTTLQRNGRYIHGTEVAVNCDSGYVPAIDNGTAFCNASRWWKAIPTCTQSDNRALGSRTSQKETNKNIVVGNSWLARDGHTASKSKYCSRIPRVVNPWWKAVMTSIYNVTKVQIYNRLNKRKTDLVGAEIRVGMKEDYLENLLCGEPITGEQIEASTADRHGIPIECRTHGLLGIIGNVISVHIPIEEKRELSLCEVEVYVEGGPISVTIGDEGGQVGCVVPHVENATIGSTGVAKQQVILAGGDIRFSCDPGYYLTGSDINHVDLVCLSNSSWNKVLPVCKPQTCTVRRLDLGSFPGRKIVYNHGENISFTCNDGYQKQFNTTYWCDKSNVLPSIPACVSASCNAPDLPDHMISPQRRYGHNTLLNVSCEVGFRLSANGENNLPLCIRGNWNISVSVVCERVPCLQPGRDTQSTVEILPGVERYVHGARIRYSCGAGWEIEGIAERECNNGEWTGSQPECRVAAPPRCMLPERSNGEIFSILGYTGRIFDQGLPIGEHVSISVRCNPGSSPQSAVRTECLDRGQWSVSVPICVRMERLCAKPGYISRVVQYVNGVDTNELGSYPHQELPEGTFLVSRCYLPGQYRLRGSANRTCFEGSWTGVEPRCDYAETQIIFQNNQPLEIRSNGTIVIYTRSRLYIHCRMPYGSNATAKWISDNGPGGVYWDSLSAKIISVNPPRADHSGHFTCQSLDGILSHSVFIQFAAIDCEQPGEPTDGALLDNDYGWKRERYPMGKEVTFTCNIGYSRDGARRSKCVFGEWSHPVPRCIRATCPELQPPNHGTLIGGNTVGHSVVIGCIRGYELQGEQFLDCLESGNWSHRLPTCIEIVEPEMPCDSVTCEVWQKCVVDLSNVGVCRCISPSDCPLPAPDQPEVCGTDGRNYTTMCHLKALACILNNGVEEASRTVSCINGVPERVVPPPTVPDANNDEQNLLSSSSFESPVQDPSPNAPSIVEPTIPANESQVETDTPRQRRSYSFCDAGQCPTSTAAELCQDAAAIVIAYANEWDADMGILELEIYEVMFGDLPAWTVESFQEVAINVSAASELGCICPSFRPTEPYIIGFSQDPALEGTPQLLHTDIVMPYSSDLNEEIKRRLQDELQPNPKPNPQDSVSSSFSSMNNPEPRSLASSSDPDIITTTTTNTQSVEDQPQPSLDSSYVV